MNPKSKNNQQAASSAAEKRPSLAWLLVKTILYYLPHILTSRLALRTFLFFSVCFGILSVLVFRCGYPKILLWIFALPLFLASAVISFRISLRGVPADSQGPRVYDKAKYHYDGDFPEGLSPKQAFVFTGMFVGWLIEHDLITAEFLEEARKFRERKVTGAQVYEAWDGCLASDELTDEGNRFAADYFEGDKYLDDYVEILVKDLPSCYHVADTWENYEAIKKKIDQRYEAWKKKQKSEPH